MLICVTGRSGTGKTTILKLLSGEWRVATMDTLVHDLLYRRGQPGYEIVARAFGPSYVTPDRVDRERLGALVFSDKAQLGRLNALMQPQIARLLCGLRRSSAGRTVLVEAAAVLSNMDRYARFFDKMILITAPEALIEKNARARFRHVSGDVYEYMKTPENPALFDLVVHNDKTPAAAAETIRSFLAGQGQKTR